MTKATADEIAKHIYLDFEDAVCSDTMPLYTERWVTIAKLLKMSLKEKYIRLGVHTVMKDRDKKWVDYLKGNPKDIQLKLLTMFVANCRYNFKKEKEEAINQGKLTPHYIAQDNLSKLIPDFYDELVRDYGLKIKKSIMEIIIDNSDEALGIFGLLLLLLFIILLIYISPT